MNMVDDAQTVAGSCEQALETLLQSRALWPLGPDKPTWLLFRHVQARLESAPDGMLMADGDLVVKLTQGSRRIGRFWAVNTVAPVVRPAEDGDQETAHTAFLTLHLLTWYEQTPRFVYLPLGLAAVGTAQEPSDPGIISRWSSDPAAIGSVTRRDIVQHFASYNGGRAAVETVPPEVLDDLIGEEHFITKSGMFPVGRWNFVRRVAMCNSSESKHQDTRALLAWHQGDVCCSFATAPLPLSDRIGHAAGEGAWDLLVTRYRRIGYAVTRCAVSVAETCYLCYADSMPPAGEVGKQAVAPQDGEEGQTAPASQ